MGRKIVVTGFEVVDTSGAAHTVTLLNNATTVGLVRLPANGGVNHEQSFECSENQPFKITGTSTGSGMVHYSILPV